METLVWGAICEIQYLSVDPRSHLREPRRLSLMIAEFCAWSEFLTEVAEHVLVFACLRVQSVVVEEPFL